MPISNPDNVRKMIGYADRKEYLTLEDKHYNRSQCYEMWINPQD